MGKIKNWEKVLDDTNHHTGGGIYSDTQRWKHESGDFLLEIGIDKEKIPKGANLELYTGDGERLDLKPVENSENMSRTELRNKMRKMAVRWMDSNSEPSRNSNLN